MVMGTSLGTVVSSELKSLSETKIRSISIAPGRTLKVTPVFDTYWRFAGLRQSLFMQRAAGAQPPWTDDQVLATHRFTNVYRAADRVSQYLIRHVIYNGPQDPEEIFFRVILFKLFNRIGTWEELTKEIGLISWKRFDLEKFSSVLDAIMLRGERVYSPAYIMPSPSFGNARKHRNHLCLLEYMMRDGAPRKIIQGKSLRDVFEILLGYPSFGKFLAYQFAIDLNYSDIVNFSEMDFVVAGPGAQDGIRKCFADTAGFSDAAIIKFVTEFADEEFERLGLNFPRLWGRPLHLIDCQNLFCEVDKYARIVHPNVKGISGRTRIKQKYTPNHNHLPQWYPPKWNLKAPNFLEADDFYEI